MNIRSLGVLGVLFILVGVIGYTTGTFIAGINMILKSQSLHTLSTFIVWYSGSPLFVGLLLLAVQIFMIRPRRHRTANIENPLEIKQLVVAVLTAYNDEESIGAAVEDFKKNKHIGKVIVIDNNSSDRTATLARRAGAKVFVEEKPGYGQCVFRALTEGLKYRQYSHVLLCEGDMTFRAHDVEKFLAYAPHVDIVNGTRILEQLRAKKTQLSTFMYYGNFFVGKLLEIKHIGRGTFTDVGTTYKLCNSEALRTLMPKLNSNINLEFNAYFLDAALQHDLSLLECPVTFHARLGKSKGGNVNDRRALIVGLRMIRGLIFGWRMK